MYDSNFRIKRQWNDISAIFSKREDFQPFRYGKNIRIVIDDEEIPVLSKRDLVKKKEYIEMKYGKKAFYSTMRYDIDMPSLVEVVEKSCSKLLGTKGNTKKKAV